MKCASCKVGMEFIPKEAWNEAPEFRCPVCDRKKRPKCYGPRKCARCAIKTGCGM